MEEPELKVALKKKWERKMNISYYAHGKKS